jgi:hypothetical protein
MAWASWTTTGIPSSREGVETVEAGVLRGELDIHTTWADGQAIVAVQYTGAPEWFTLRGSPVPCPTEQASRDLHQAVVDAVRNGEQSPLLQAHTPESR